MELKTAFLLMLLGAPAYYFFLLCRNYLEARKLGVPIVIVPMNPASPLWFLISPRLHKFLSSIGLNRAIRFAHLGWCMHAKAKPFIEYDSTVFVHVSPAGLWLNLADPTAITQLLAGERKGIWERPSEGMKVMEVFGPNISTVGANDWQRMRRVTAKTFNETTMRTVWAETLRQGREVLQHWLEAGQQGTATTADDTTSMALNVMLSAGFGKQYDFETAKKEEAAILEGGAMDYREAIRLVVGNAVAIIGIGPKNLSTAAKVFPGLKKLHAAVTTFHQYMTDMLNEKGQEGAMGNLLASLVQAGQDNTLTQKEVFGNMFVFTFGGHDTTAHSLAFSFVLLSIRPEVQAWVREELRTVLKSSNPDDWSYENYPKLKRVLAIQYETIRLYNPVLGVMKSNRTDTPQELSLANGKRKLVVPPGVPMTILTNSIHAHPKYWGEDALEWKPSRWIQADENGVEQMLVPETGVYQAWGDGLRACPGKKFGHIEHVALMAAVLYGHSVEAAREKGETPQQTKERINGVIEDRGMTLTVHMLHPERARLVWKKFPELGEKR